jgi:hypothetical protein
MSSLSHLLHLKPTSPALAIRRRWQWACAFCLGLLLGACGGGGGSGPAPGTQVASAAPVTEPSLATHASIGPDGGSLTTTGSNGVSYTLAVPPGALTSAVDIRLTPISDMGSAPLARGSLGAVQMEPSGLVFLRPATLRIGAVAALKAGERLAGFGSANDGSRLGLKFAKAANGATEIDVSHFSTGGAGTLTPAEFAKLVPVVALNPADQFWDDLMRLPLDQLNDNTVGPPAAALFRSWYLNVVKPALEAELLAAPQVLVNPGIGAYELWLHSRVRFEELTNGNSSATRLLADIDTQASGLVSQILVRQIDLAIAACSRLSNIRTLSEAQYYQNMAVEFVMNTAALGLDNARFLTKVNSCLRPVLDPITLPAGLKIGTGKSLNARAMLVFNGQPNPVAAPFIFTVTATGSAPQTASGRSNAEGRYTTVFTPNAASMQFIVKACLVLDLISVAEGSDICVQQNVSGSVGPLVKTYSGPVAFQQPASGVTFTGFLRVTIADAGAVNSIKLVEASGSFVRNDVGSTSCGPPPQLIVQLPFTESTTTPMTGKFVVNGISGQFEFAGRLRISATNPVNTSISCETVVTVSDDPTLRTLAAFPFISVEMLNGAVQTIVLDKTLFNTDGSPGNIYTGRLELDP